MPGLMMNAVCNGMGYAWANDECSVGYAWAHVCSV